MYLLHVKYFGNVTVMIYVLEIDLPAKAVLQAQVQNEKLIFG